MSNFQDVAHLKLQQTVFQGLNNVLCVHTRLINANSKAEGEKEWSHLTQGVTMLRRMLSKLEKEAYETLTHKFDRKPEQPVNHHHNGYKEIPKYYPKGRQKNQQQQQHRKQSQQPLPLPKKDEEEDFYDEDDLGAVLVKLEETSSTEDTHTSSAVSSGHVSIEEDERCCQILMDRVTSLPAQPHFRPDETFEAQLLYVVSPLEFYLVRKRHLGLLKEVEDVLDMCLDKIMTLPLNDSDFAVGHACLGYTGTALVRAEMRIVGIKDVQVYLVDYGRSLFLHRNNCFSLPRCIAKISPPLAHFCTLTDADSRMLDNAAIHAFQGKISRPEIMIRSYGERRRTHGEFVEIIE